MSKIKEAAARMRKVAEECLAGSACPISNVYQPDPAFSSIADFNDDQNRLVAAYLYDHPADDDVKATNEWLESAGLTDWSFLRDVKDWRKDRDGLIVAKSFACVGGWELRLVVDSWPIKDHPTRRDVRQLCKAVGVKLNEITK